MIIVVGSPLHVPADDQFPAGVAGLAAEVARAAAAAGSTVQLVGKVGDDPAGDASLIALTRLGVGHAAILRDPSRATPAALPPRSVEDSFDDASFGDPGSDDGAAEGGPRPGHHSSSAEADDAGLRGLDEDAGVRGLADQPVLEPADLELALRYLGGFRVVVVAEPLGPDGLAVVSDAASYAGAALVLLVPDESRSPDIPGATILATPPHDPDGLFARTVGEFAAALDLGVPPAEAFRTATTSVGWQQTEPS